MSARPSNSLIRQVARLAGETHAGRSGWNGNRPTAAGSCVDRTCGRDAGTRRLLTDTGVNVLDASRYDARIKALDDRPQSGLADPAAAVVILKEKGHRLCEALVVAGWNEKAVHGIGDEFARCAAI